VTVFTTLLGKQGAMRSSPARWAAELKERTHPASKTREPRPGSTRVSKFVRPEKAGCGRHAWQDGRPATRWPHRAGPRGISRPPCLLARMRRRRHQRVYLVVDGGARPRLKRVGDLPRGHPSATGEPRVLLMR